MAQAVKAVFNTHIWKFYQQYKTTRLMCNYAKNALHNVRSEPHNMVADTVTKLTGTDFLFSNLKNAVNTKTVLDMVSAHSGIMNNKHIMQALRSLFTLQKHGHSELSTQEILGHRDFRKLCRQLRNQAESIELNETIEALKVVSYVGVPADSTIVQVLLQLIRHNINFLSLQQIVFLDFLLAQFKPCPLVDALKIALPLVFEIQLPTKMEYDNVAHLSDMLHFASRSNLSERAVERIVQALEQQHHDFDGKTAKSLIWSICDMPSSEVYKNLMTKAINALVVHLDDFDYNDLETTLSKLISRYSRKTPWFYDQTFYDSCANYIIDKDLGYRHSIYALRKFSRVNHFNSFLLDYMSKKLYEDPDLLLKGDPADIYSIAVATSLTDFRPVHWDHLKALILQTDNVANSDRKEIIWIKFASALCLLDIYKLDVLTKCLNESFLQNLFRRRFMSDFENYCTIWQCIKLYKPELNCLLSSKYAPEVLAKNYRPPPDLPLEESLHKAFGGEKYVKTGLYSKLGIQIDHAVVFRKGGYPVAMSHDENIEFIEDLELSPDNQLIVIMGLRHFSYILNNRRLRANSILSMKALESKGYTVVPVCLEMWLNLPDFEKIPYLMQSIKERTQSDVSVLESVI